MSAHERTERSAPTILLVEDEILVRLGMADELRSAGLNVVEAGSAEQALNFLTTRPNIQLVSTDLRMPGLDGIALARWVKQNKSMPVLLVTGEHIANGCTYVDDVLEKPFLDGELPARVLRLLATFARSADT